MVAIDPIQTIEGFGFYSSPLPDVGKRNPIEGPLAYQGQEPYIFVCFGYEDADTVYP